MIKRVQKGVLRKLARRGTFFKVKRKITVTKAGGTWVQKHRTSKGLLQFHLQRAHSWVDGCRQARETI